MFSSIIIFIGAVGVLYVMSCLFVFEDAEVEHKLNTKIDCVKFKFDSDNNCIESTFNGKHIPNIRDRNPRETVYWYLIHEHNLWLSDYSNDKYSTIIRRRDNILVNFCHGKNYYINLNVEFV